MPPICQQDFQADGASQCFDAHGEPHSSFGLSPLLGQIDLSTKVAASREDTDRSTTREMVRTIANQLLLASNKPSRQVPIQWKETDSAHQSTRTG